MKKYLIGSVSVLALPFIALAQYSATNASSVFSSLNTLFSSLVSLILALAGLYFIWGLLKYISKAGDEKEQKTARGQMLWGIIIIAVMLMFWGAVNLIKNSIGANYTAPTTTNLLPNVQ
jgi:succinate dehydrogenase/fumarate reductase cytochrome b subunit